MLKKINTNLKKLIYILPILYFLVSCTDELKVDNEVLVEELPIIIEEYGYNFNDFNVVRDTIHSGDTFGDLLSSYGVSNQKILEVASKFRDSFDVRKIVVGKPYVLLNSKDTLNATQIFIYEKNKIDYAVVDLRDSINIYTSKKPITFIEKSASGIIMSSLSQTMDEQNLGANMTDELAMI